MGKRFFSMLLGMVFLLGMFNLLFGQNELPPPEISPILSTILGLIAPYVCQFVVKRVNEALLRGLLAVIASAVIGIVGALIEGVPLDFTAVAYVSWVVTVAQSAFNFFWKPMFNGNTPLFSRMKHIE